MAADDSDDAAVGELIGGRYRVEGELGRGGMGVVYEAVQEPLGRRVALKLLRRELAEDPNFAARFRREAELAASLGHANIAQVTDFGVDEGRPFLVMDLLIGESLAELLAREGMLSEPRAAFIAAQMLDALSAAHARGVIHRDLKPDNVFLSQISGVRDVVKLLDFGIAHSGGDEGMRMTRTGQVLGTPAYMSPEQARGRDVGEASDLYAVGVCLYEAVSGRLPFDTGNYHELLFSIVGEEPPPLESLRPDLSPELCAVVARAMDKAPASRFPDAGSMREALLPIAHASSSTGDSRVSGMSAVAKSARTPVAYAPTVTPAPTPANRTPVAYAPTVTPATEPPAPLVAVHPASTEAHAQAKALPWRTMFWMVAGLVVAAFAVVLGRVTGEHPVAPTATPPTDGLHATLETPDASVAPTLGAPTAPTPTDALVAPTEAALVDASPPHDAVEVAAAAVPARPRAPRQPRTRTVDCGGHPRELTILRPGDRIHASFMQGNNIVDVRALRRQAEARDDEYAACYRGHPILQGRLWEFTLNDVGVVTAVEPRGYCDIDPPVTSCMRRLWMGYHFDGFQGSAGSVRIGIGIAGL